MENIIVLCGGRSAEHEISIISARAVIKGLNASGYRVQALGIKKNGSAFTSNEISVILDIPVSSHLEYPECSNWISWLSLLHDANPVVFPVLHGPYGEDGTVQGLLELLDFPYVGAGVSGSAVAMNKIHTKEILKSHGMPVLPWITVNRRDLDDLRDVCCLPDCEFDFPVFVKPANMGSSVGISKAANPETLRSAIHEALRYDEYALIEKGINAREIEVSVLGFHPQRISVPGEIIPSGEFYSYEAKYLSEESKLIIPAALEDAQKKNLNRLASAAFNYLQLEGMARIDFLLARDTGDIWINETNTMPGFTRISMYPKLWEATGLSFPELMKDLVTLAQERKNRRNKLEVDR
ncbi:MAG: D-alanine--D-alanine ligase family protein [Acidobacteriota bacterium]